MRKLQKRIVIVGIGNELRGDDGIGLEFIKNFSYINVDKIWLRFLDFDIIERISNYDIVIFVDASVRVKDFELTRVCDMPKSNTFSHYPSYKNIIEFIKKNYNPDMDAYVLEIEGKNFDFYQEISEHAKKNVKKAQKFLKKFIDTIFHIKN